MSYLPTLHELVAYGQGMDNWLEQHYRNSSEHRAVFRRWRQHPEEIPRDLNRGNLETLYTFLDRIQQMDQPGQRFHDYRVLMRLPEVQSPLPGLLHGHEDSNALDHLIGRTSLPKEIRQQIVSSNGRTLAFEGGVWLNRAGPWLELLVENPESWNNRSDPDLPEWTLIRMAANRETGGQVQIMTLPAALTLEDIAARAQVTAVPAGVLRQRYSEPISAEAARLAAEQRKQVRAQLLQDADRNYHRSIINRGKTSTPTKTTDARVDALNRAPKVMRG